MYLCQTGIIPSAIAMDIGKGPPLQQATAHIKQQGLSSRIRTRLSDGLTALQPGEADTILIAGMGGGLVMKILSQGTHALTGQ
ncbi:MAG: tRNA (adenine(22)-N(1))-methyltransferase TrmK [Eubacterium ramulus]